MNLFESQNDGSQEPLAYRMRPKTLKQYSGQDHIVGEGRLLRRMIQADRLSSLIFYGPPGTGKTTLARVIANSTKSAFITLNAVLTGVKTLREEIEKATERFSLHGKRTILFVDEIHRWNKSQQDALLPSVEKGTIILIGATTENPYFEVNSALVSRSRIFQLKTLGKNDLFKIAKMALSDPVRGYGKYKVVFGEGALEHLVDIANGDARSLLNAMELAVETTGESFPPEDGDEIFISLKTAEESIQKKVLLYDKEGDYHFDIISAFIKSIRGSDPDAALYWLAKMIRGGEDPRFILRRMLISASEDVGLADPGALGVVTAAAAAFDRVGLPEGRFHLTQAALYLATAPKSNSTMGFFDALGVVEREEASGVPNHLKDGGRDKEGFGHGKGYLYPHAYHDHWVAQQYLPDSLKGKVFYNPSTVGYEGKLREEILKKREASLSVDSPGYQEILSTAPVNNVRDRWLDRLNTGQNVTAGLIRDDIFEKAGINSHFRVLVLNADDGLLLWEACRQASGGAVYAVSRSSRGAENLVKYSVRLPSIERPIIVSTPLAEFSPPENICFETIIGRNVLVREEDKRGYLGKVKALLNTGGKVVLGEVIPARSKRVSSILSEIGGEFKLETPDLEILKEAEKIIYNWDENSLRDLFLAEGFTRINMENLKLRETRIIRHRDIEKWFNPHSEHRGYGSVIKELAGIESLERIAGVISTIASEREVEWPMAVCTITAEV